LDNFSLDLKPWLQDANDIHHKISILLVRPGVWMTLATTDNTEINSISGMAAILFKELEV
jgi:hypothetical protein